MKFKLNQIPKLLLLLFTCFLFVLVSVNTAQAHSSESLSSKVGPRWHDMGTGSGALDASATLFNPPEPSSNLVSDILSRIFREVKFSNKSFSSGSHIYFFRPISDFFNYNYSNWDKSFAEKEFLS
ncbi:hypothetical protein AKJ50_01705 [candidate division MSBL1 archaeon SCGC-AAA382A13]|uniref:Uncharacterized protein n=1 Tax=candidate division MSBL1 archaeon SCGC-AAA382A13 TaxID=1698279 RepID=A0A133VFD0_9EURY|nr:hypothetical protein AKJ50_01705 [candidate division MSBL1 archaeon SCGC-AAA382A13]